MIKSLKLSVQNSPAKLDVIKFLRSLRCGGEKMFSINEAAIEADELFRGEKEYCIPKFTELAGCNRMFYALANGNTTFGRYPLYDFEKTFIDVPDFLRVVAQDDDESHARIADEDYWTETRNLLESGANGNALDAIEFCKRKQAGKFHEGPMG